jgi:hypothetical protein
MNNINGDIHLIFYMKLSLPHINNKLYITVTNKTKILYTISSQI